jgi:hypothetical protein
MDVAGTDDTADDTAEGRAGTMTRWYGPIRGCGRRQARADRQPAGRFPTVAYLISTPTTEFQPCVINVVAAFS